MTGRLGDLAVRVTADTRAYSTGIRRVVAETRGATREMSAAIAPVTRGFSGLSAVLGGAAGFGAFASIEGAIRGVSRAMSDLDRIGKDARSAGLSPEFYQTLAFAADEASISQDAINQALVAFTRNVGLAAAGKGELVEKLRQLNPELLASITSAKSQQEAFLAVADAVRSSSSATDAAAIASAAFGDSGVRLVEVVRQGAAGFEETARRAREMGLILSDEMVAAAEDMQTQFSTAARVIDTQFKSVLIDLAPVLVDTANLMATLTRRTAEEYQAIKAFFADPTISKVINGALGPGTISRTGGGMTALDAVSAEIESLRTRQTAPGILGAAVRNADAADLQRLEIERRRLERAELSGVGMRTSVPLVAPAAVSLSDVLSSSPIARATGGGSRSGAGRKTPVADAIGEATDLTKGFDAAMKDLRGTAEQSKTAFDGFGRTVGDALSPILQTLTKDLGEVERALIKTGLALAQALLQTSPFGQSGFGGVLASALGSFAGGFANGGTLRPGEWGVVGERGPETVFAGRSPLHVMPAGQGGSGPINVSVSLAGANGDAQIAAAARRAAQEGAALALRQVQTGFGGISARYQRQRG